MESSGLLWITTVVVFKRWLGGGWSGGIWSRWPVLYTINSYDVAEQQTSVGHNYVAQSSFVTRLFRRIKSLVVVGAPQEVAACR